MKAGSHWRHPPPQECAKDAVRPGPGTAGPHTDGARGRPFGGDPAKGMERSDVAFSMRVGSRCGRDAIGVEHAVAPENRSTLHRRVELL